MAHGKPSSNPNDFILPDLGEGVHEAELLKWRVKVGDRIEELDVLADMETDKAVLEVTSTRAGVIAATHGEVGDIVKVGSALVTFAPEGHAVEAKPAKGAKAEPAAKAKARPMEAPEDEEREDAGTVVGISPGASAKALATPAVRRLARDLGVDIDHIRGSGIGGRVMEKDVRTAANGGMTRGRAAHADVAPSEPEEPVSGVVADRGRAPQPGRTSAPTRGPSSAPTTPQHRTAPAPRPAAPPMPAGAETVRIPFRGVRRTIANRLRESVDRAVHFNVMDEADVTELDSLRRKLAAASGERVSVLPFVASAACRVLTQERFRPMNATVDEKPEDPSHEGAIVQHRGVHLGIATDTESGLMVPVIRDCDALGVLEIARQIAQVSEAARDRSIARDRLIGSTFTISNVGSHAGRFATPIINYPEVGILAVGRGRQGPVVRTVGGSPGIFVGMMLPLSLACDHRVVDGATGALALAEIVRLLQDPESLLGPARG